MQGGHNFERLVNENGHEMEWMFKDDPEATVRYLLKRELVDLQTPENSLLLLKPLNEVEHGGGIKMERNDTDYMAFLGWIQDLSKAVNNEYTDVESLPDTNRRNGSEIWVRFERLPELLKGETGFITLHRLTDAGWSEQPSAISSFNVRANRQFGIFAQGFLMIETPDQSAQERIPSGTYQVRLHIDPKQRDTESSFETALNASTEIARTEVESEWLPGWNNATKAVIDIGPRRLIQTFSKLVHKRECLLSLQQLNLARLAFKLDVGEEPHSVAALVTGPENAAQMRTWRGPYLERSPKDPWGGDFQIELLKGEGGPQPVFISAGPDGEFKTSDDIRFRPGIG